MYTIFHEFWGMGSCVNMWPCGLGIRMTGEGGTGVLKLKMYSISIDIVLRGYDVAYILPLFIALFKGTGETC